MEYIVFNKAANEFYVRDSPTSSHNRVTFKVIAFYIDDHCFRFELEQKNVLGVKEIYYPKQNTVLSII